MWHYNRIGNGACSRKEIIGTLIIMPIVVKLSFKDKHCVLFVGHRQKEQNQIRRLKTRRLIRFSTVCLQNFISKLE